MIWNDDMKFEVRELRKLSNTNQFLTFNYLITWFISWHKDIIFRICVMLKYNLI